MAGTLVITTLSDGTNSTSATNCIQGSAKAWVNFDGTGTVAIRSSYNVSSITDNGTGDYTVNFTNALPNANYAVTLTAQRSATNSFIGYAIKQGGTYSTSAVQVTMWGEASYSAEDMSIVCVSVFSS
jgi:hypothetical protein